MGAKSFSGGIGEGGDFQSAFESVTYGRTTRTEKKLPPPTPAPAIPARTGSSLPVKSVGSSGSATGLTLKGAVVVTSSDGIFTISYPESVETTVDGVTLVIPAIAKTP